MNLSQIQIAAEHLMKYKPLIRELVVRDLKVKYRRSFLGYLWSLLNPLLMMAVMLLVFNNILDVYKRQRQAGDCAASGGTAHRS